MVKLTRKFHPVGFGAFYTECHESDGREINVVYDCGTLRNSKFIISRIKSQFPNKKTVIDILFISHFHKDHISGIPFLMKHCVINKVVIPFIPKEDRALFVVGEGLDSSFEGLVLDTEAYFGKDTVIIRISRNGENNLPLDPIENVQPSGGKIKISSSLSMSLKWIFVPFNYNYAKYVPKLKNELKKQKLDYDRLSEKGYVQNHYDDVKRAYREMCLDQNKTSLILYSGLIEDCPYYDFIAITRGKLIELLFESHAGGLLNCVYFGDTCMKDDSTVDAFKNEILEKYKVSYRTLQVPHHGSKKSFNARILDNNSVSVVSCDFKSYGLPNASITKEIVKAGSILIAVTDELDTAFEERGEY